MLSAYLNGLAHISNKFTLPVFELGSYFTLAFHTAVFMLTLYKTLSSSRQAKAAGIKNSLFSVILRDGTFPPHLLKMLMLRFNLRRRDTVLYVRLCPPEVENQR